MTNLPRAASRADSSQAHSASSTRRATPVSTATSAKPIRLDLEERRPLMRD